MGKNNAGFGQEDLSEEICVSVETKGYLGATQVGSQDRTMQMEPKNLLRSPPGKECDTFSELTEGLSGRQGSRGAEETTQEVTAGTEYNQRRPRNVPLQEFFVAAKRWPVLGGCTK